MDLAIAIKAAILSVLASIGISATTPAAKIKEYVKENMRKENHGAEVSGVARVNKELLPAATPRVKASPTPFVTPTPKPESKNHGAEVSAVAQKGSLDISVKVK